MLLECLTMGTQKRRVMPSISQRREVRVWHCPADGSIATGPREVMSLSWRWPSFNLGLFRISTSTRANRLVRHSGWEDISIASHPISTLLQFSGADLIAAFRTHCLPLPCDSTQVPQCNLSQDPTTPTPQTAVVLSTPSILVGIFT
jgi:hypothetical protein